MTELTLRRNDNNQLPLSVPDRDSRPRNAKQAKQGATWESRLLLLLTGLMLLSFAVRYSLPASTPNWWKHYKRKCEACKLLVDNSILAIRRYVQNPHLNKVPNPIDAIQPLKDVSNLLTSAQVCSMSSMDSEGFAGAAKMKQRMVRACYHLLQIKEVRQMLVETLSGNTPHHYDESQSMLAMRHYKAICVGQGYCDAGENFF
jgi:hypothetical protein